MKLTIAPRGVLQIDDATIIWRNFEGREQQYNRPGDRNFSLLIDDEEIAEALQNEVNQYGVGWNVKIKPAREDGDQPFMHLPVKVKFNDKGPHVYLVTNGKRNKLTEETVGMLDHIDILNVNLDIRPYDNEVNGKPFRTAYLQSIEVIQDVDRFAERYAEEEYPAEEVF